MGLPAKTWTVVLLGTLALAGCHSAPPERVPGDGDNAAEMMNEAAPENIITAPLPPVNVSNTATATPPKINDDVQMHDDADATGMTARLRDNEPEAPVTDQATNETQPAK